MDLLSLLGICIAFAAIITGNFLDGGDLSPLLNAPAALVVFGGTLGATILQTPYPVLARGLAMLRWIIVPPSIKPGEQVKKMLNLSKVARRDGLLGLEDQAAREKDRLLKKGLGLLADGHAPALIRQQLEDEIEQAGQRDARAASMFDHMGGYAPTIGIIGAVMGLIHVMGNLSEPDKVGVGIATAFVATIYGVGFANLLLFPIAGKLKETLKDLTRLRLLVLEGLIAIAEGEHPAVLESRLKGLAGMSR